MNKIREMLQKPIYTAIAGFVLGLIIGLPLLGWVVFPVQWFDAAPQHLRKDVQDDYLRLAIGDYTKTSNKEQAIQRFKDFGPAGAGILKRLGSDGSVDPKALMNFSAVVGKPVVLGTPAVSGKATKVPTGPTQPAVKATKPAATTGKSTATLSEADIILQTIQAQQNTDPNKTPAASGTTTKPKSSSLVWVLGILCFVTLAVGGALLYFLVLRKGGKASPKNTAPAMEAEEANRQTARTNYALEGQDAPVAQYMSTYMLGYDLYDDSFSIDSGTGDFLGECGVGISDTIGVGDPKKVTALEVWLFDKNDIQTITKVLMSEYAYNDPTIRQRLASKGEPVLVKPGEHVVLETHSLILEARIVDMSYGQGATPASSYFERVTLELAVWTKPETNA